MNRPQVKNTLLKALHKAILWEESCIDADTHMGDRKLLRDMRGNIKHFTELMNEIAPNRPMTLHEYLDRGLATGETRLVGLNELKDMATTQTKGNTP